MFGRYAGRRSVEAALRRTLHEVVTTAEQALARAQARRAQGEAAIRDSLAALDGQIQTLAGLEQNILQS
jgi:hypothetical protein